MTDAEKLRILQHRNKLMDAAIMLSSLADRTCRTEETILQMFARHAYEILSKIAETKDEIQRTELFEVLERYVGYFSDFLDVCIQQRE